MGFHTMGCMGWKLDDHLIIFSIISWENIRKKMMTVTMGLRMVDEADEAPNLMLSENGRAW